MNTVEKAIETISKAISYPKSPEVREAFKTLRTALGIETPYEDDKSVNKTPEPQADLVNNVGSSEDETV